MDAKQEAGTTEFFDRPFKIFRVKRNGVLERLGGTEGGMKVRLVRDPSSLTPYLLLHHSGSGSLICKAQITEKVQEVSKDGYTIHLHLQEESVHNFKRRYIFVFHDEDASIKFFRIYEELRGRKDGDHTFWDLQEEEGGAVGDDFNFYFISGEDELKLVDLACNFDKLKIEKEEEDLDDQECNQSDDSEKENDGSNSGNEFDSNEDDLKDGEGPFDLPSLDDFSQDVFALNTHVVLPKRW